MSQSQPPRTPDSQPPAAPPGAPTVAASSLHAGALRLPGVLMQGVTHIAPAVGMVLTIQFITSQAGVTSPLAYTIAFLITLTLAISLTQLAKHLPSAGGYYTYVSHTVHPRAGFLTSWIYFLYDPTGAAINIAFMGFFFEGTMKGEYGFDFPWWAFFLIAGTIVWFFTYFGIEISAIAIVILGAIEISIVVLLGIWGLFDSGPGGITGAPFNITNSTSTNGLFLGVVLSIFAFTGFESVAPLAEESENPRRNIPRGILGSILIMGAFYLFTSWALLVGFGVDRVGPFVNSTENPIFVLAKHLWGGAWVVILAAVINSIIAVSIATTNAATRVFFAMARSGSLPAPLAHVHPRYRTPSTAIWFQTFVTFAFGLGLGFWIGPDQEFFMMGTTITLGLVVVYSMGNVGVFRFYRGDPALRFNWLLHLLFPLFSTCALFLVAVYSFKPFPAAPISYSPWIVIGWFAIGAGVLVWMRARGREEWLLKAGEAAFERPETTEELGRRHV